MLPSNAWDRLADALKPKWLEKVPKGYFSVKQIALKTNNQSPSAVRKRLMMLMKLGKIDRVLVKESRESHHPEWFYKVK